MSGDGVPPTINITNVAQAKNEGCGTGCGGCLAVFIAIMGVTLFVGAGWFLGSWIAVAVFGAAEGSTAAVTVGWIFEIVYLALLGVAGWALWKNRVKLFGKGDGGFEPSPAGRTIPGETTTPDTPTEDEYPTEPGQSSSTSSAPPDPLREQQSGPSFCHHCGSPLRVDARFCSTCGTSL